MHNIGGMKVIIVDSPSKVEIPTINRIFSWPWKPWVRYYSVSAPSLYNTLKDGSCVASGATIYMTRNTYNNICSSVPVA